MRLINRRGFLKTSGAAGLAMLVGGGLVGGCNSEFYRTDFIRKKADEIIKTRDELIRKYLEESGTKELEHPKRKKESWVRVNEDQTYTLTYEVEFADTASLKTLVEEQINGPKKEAEKKALISALPDTNKLIITIKERTDLSRLETILGDADQLPPQILLKFSATADFGDRAQDYATELSMEFKTTGGDLGAITDNAQFPGAAERVRTRVDMGARWGAQIDTSVFDMKAVLDTLESWGYARHVFETYILLSNGQEGALSGEEKLPIPEQVLQGLNSVITQKLELSKSESKATAFVRGEMVDLSLTATVSSSKRPDIRKPDFLVPVSDTISIKHVYAPMRVPIIIGGKLIEMEVGMLRRDALLRGLSSSKDYEKSLTRVYYEITPYGVVKYGKPDRLTFKYETLKSSAPPIEPSKETVEKKE